MRASSTFHAGDWVQVRTKEEILQTLDKNGQLEGLPFMPEMFAFCGRRFRVFKRAHKTCDPPNGMGGRRMLHAVHLEDIRCDGSAHGRCQARCLVFWKDAWLKGVDGDAESGAPIPQRPSSNVPLVALTGCTEQDVVSGTRVQAEQVSSGEAVYICQSTQMAQATHPLRSWDLRQYIEDYTSGNVPLYRLPAAFVVLLCQQIVSAGLGLGSALRWVYDTVQRIRGGPPFPWRHGTIPRGTRTPSARLHVQPGDLVKVRSHTEILATIDEDRNNRGMSFDPEMVPYCGGTYQVLDRITHLINEKTGKMQYLKNDCIMLDRVVCKACYSKHRRFCPRSIYPYWREVWLERVEPNPGDTSNHMTHPSG